MEGVPAESGVLLQFPGGSRPLLADSGEKACVTTFFSMIRADAFVTPAYFQNEQNGGPKKIPIPKFDFARLDCACNFVDRLKEKVGNVLKR